MPLVQIGDRDDCLFATGNDAITRNDSGSWCADDAVDPNRTASCSQQLICGVEGVPLASKGETFSEHFS